MSRLVFLAVNASYSHTSLAAMRLRGVADPETWEWTTLETAIADSRDSMLERVLALKPDVLATTFYLFNREWLTAFLARFRALSPRTVVIGGGQVEDVAHVVVERRFHHPPARAEQGHARQKEEEVAFQAAKPLDE